MAKGKTTILFCLFMLGALVLLAACGNSAATSTGSGTTSSTAATPTSSGNTSSTGSSYGSGKYGNGGSGSSTTTPAPTQAVSGPTKTVMITTDSSGNFAFSPTSLTIAAGTTVVWKNTTSIAHTVTSNDQKTFNSGDSTPVNSNATFSFTFKTAGTFAYHCDFHPYMKATIIVK